MNPMNPNEPLVPKGSFFKTAGLDGGGRVCMNLMNLFSRCKEKRGIRGYPPRLHTKKVHRVHSFIDPDAVPGFSNEPFLQGGSWPPQGFIPGSGTDSHAQKFMEP